MGFPHSEISGSKCVGNSPELFAAYHVLHRLSVPRHPPNALVVLDLTFCQRSDDLAITTSARSVQGTNPAHDGLHYPSCHFRLGDGARKSRLQTSLPMNDVKERTRVLCQATRLGDGGGRRDRTDDLLLAKQALSQLSYAPV